MAKTAYKVYRIRVRREANLSGSVASEENRKTSVREALLWRASKNLCKVW
jgi:hypothetical protein